MEVALFLDSAGRWFGSVLFLMVSRGAEKCTSFGRRKVHHRLLGRFETLRTKFEGAAVVLRGGGRSPKVAGRGVFAAQAESRSDGA